MFIWEYGTEKLASKLSTSDPFLRVLNSDNSICCNKGGKLKANHAQPRIQFSYRRAHIVMLGYADQNMRWCSFKILYRMSRRPRSLLQQQIAPTQVFKTLHKTFYGRRRKHCAILDSKRLAWRCVPFPARGGALQLIRQRVGWPCGDASGGQWLAVYWRSALSTTSCAVQLTLGGIWGGGGETIIVQYSKCQTEWDYQTL